MARSVIHVPVRSAFGPASNSRRHGRGSATSQLPSVRVASKGHDPTIKRLSAGQPYSSSICLTMIVKNEAHILPELLQSIHGLIDRWVICDTGSDDGTPELILKFFKRRRIPGTLHHRPWKDFGHNRTEAFRLADGKADYMWVIDADDRIVGNLRFGKLDQDCYDLRYGEGVTYWRRQLFKSGLAWRYVGVLHEYPHSDTAAMGSRWEGDYFIDSRRLGARSRNPHKYRDDAEVLEQALRVEPRNSRYWFYLGQSYYDAKDYAQASRAYRQRATMGGWTEEIFYSLYRMGECEFLLGSDEEKIVPPLLAAYQARPSRAESLHALANYYRRKGKYDLAYLFAKVGSKIPFPTKDILFVHASVYQYMLLYELSVSAYYTGRTEEACQLCQRVLSMPLPESDRRRTLKNLRLFQKTPSVGNTGTSAGRASDPSMKNQPCEGAAKAGRIRRRHRR